MYLVNGIALESGHKYDIYSKVKFKTSRTIQELVDDAYLWVRKIKLHQSQSENEEKNSIKQLPFKITDVSCEQAEDV